MKKNKRSGRFSKNRRGSALLISLMVIVGLSLLGLGFVTISETETAIARNEQASLQTQAVAEAGAKLVVEWFQSPTWGLQYGMPANDGSNPNLNAIKVTRLYVDPAKCKTNETCSGVYKSDPSTMLFDKPYRATASDRFWADENTGDIIINRSTDPTTIDKINTTLLGPNIDDRRDGEITEVRVSAPPMTGARLVKNGALTNPDGTPQQFWVEATQRYGVATIKVTAQLFRNPYLTDTTTPKKTDPQNILASHSIRIVVGELPVPIPGGPIQSNTAVQFGGDFVVHWGNETSAIDPTNPASTGNLTNKRNPSTPPWANAYERTHFERGYENVYNNSKLGPGIATVLVTSGGSNYSSNPIVTIDVPCTFNGTACTPCVANLNTCIRATVKKVNVNAGVIQSIVLQENGAGYTALPPGLGLNNNNWGPKVTIIDATGTGASAIASVGAEAWPIPFTQFDSADYFHEILGKSFEDVWFGSRAAGTNNLCSPAFIQCQSYDLTNDTNDETAYGMGTPQTYAFEYQSANNYPWKKLVTFPSIVYDFWKKIAIQGRGYKGIYYFSYDKTTTNFLKSGIGTAEPMSYWANGRPPNGGKGGSGLGAGVFFFDTIDGTNPQTCGCPASNNPKLTPALSWSAADLNGDFLMSGFVYMNAKSWGTDGSGNAMYTLQANMPGEPYRDIGYPNFDPAANDWDRTCGGLICMVAAGDGAFSCETKMSNNNGRCDIVAMPSPAFYSYDPSPTQHNGNIFVEKVWKAPAEATRDYGAPCTAPAAGYDGTNAASTDCSLPHEPYLNIIYPTQDCKVNTQCLTISWEQGQGTHIPKLTDTTGTQQVACPSSPTVAQCTSNMYDVDGGLVPLTIMLDGVLYNEGDYNSAGNDAFFGSLLIKGAVTGTGTPDVWFDEKLIKGTWAPPNMPRVIVYNEQTDETQPQQ